MIETSTATHPLFDRTSLYGRMAASLRPEGKMLGYLIATWVRKDLENVPPARPHRPEVLASLARVLAGGDPSALAAPGDETALNEADGTLSPDAPHVLDAWMIDAATIVRASGEGEPLTAHGALCLIRHGAGHALAGAFAAKCETAPCRAFLFEPEVVARIKGTVGGRPWLDVFRAEVLADNFKASQALAAAPEMAGRAGPGGVLLGPVPGPDRYPTLPPRPGPVHVVVVLDD